MNYLELKSKQQSEIDDFPMAFAFNQKQLDEGLEKLGITASEAIRIPGGGFIRKTDRQSFMDMFSRHAQENDEALKEDDFLVDALEYELGNHEFCITHDPEPALSAVGVTLTNERVQRLLEIAKKLYLTAYYEWESQQACA